MQKSICICSNLKNFFHFNPEKNIVFCVVDDEQNFLVQKWYMAVSIASLLYGNRDRYSASPCFPSPAGHLACYALDLLSCHKSLAALGCSLIAIVEPCKRASGSSCGVGIVHSRKSTLAIVLHGQEARAFDLPFRNFPDVLFENAPKLRKLSLVYAEMPAGKVFPQLLVRYVLVLALAKHV